MAERQTNRQPPHPLRRGGGWRKSWVKSESHPPIAVKGGFLWDAANRRLPTPLLSAESRWRTRTVHGLTSPAVERCGQRPPGQRVGRALRSGRANVLFGVRTIQHPVCQRARAKLETLLGHSRKEVR